MKNCVPEAGTAGSPELVSITWPAAFGVAATTLSFQPSPIDQLVCIGIGFFSSPGRMNLALTRSFRVTRRLHLGAVPLHAPFHGPSFPRVPGLATSVTRLPFATWTER